MCDWPKPHNFKLLSTPVLVEGDPHQFISQEDKLNFKNTNTNNTNKYHEL